MVEGNHWVVQILSALLAIKIFFYLCMLYIFHVPVWSISSTDFPSPSDVPKRLSLTQVFQTS